MEYFWESLVLAAAPWAFLWGQIKVLVQVVDTWTKLQINDYLWIWLSLIFIVSIFGFNELLEWVY